MGSAWNLADDGLMSYDEPGRRRLSLARRVPPADPADDDRGLVSRGVSGRHRAGQAVYAGRHGRRQSAHDSLLTRPDASPGPLRGSHAAS